MVLSGEKMQPIFQIPGVNGDPKLAQFTTFALPKSFFIIALAMDQSTIYI